MKILVTGATGFVGSHSAVLLVRAGASLRRAEPAGAQG